MLDDCNNFNHFIFTLYPEGLMNLSYSKRHIPNKNYNNYDIPATRNNHFSKILRNYFIINLKIVFRYLLKCQQLRVPILLPEPITLLPDPIITLLRPLIKLFSKSSLGFQFCLLGNTGLALNTD